MPSMPGPSRYVDSYYSATANRQLELPFLSGEETADVCIIGAGYTGLSSAIHLAERGYRVIVLEAERVAWGASGRNGGQCTVGQRQPQEWLEEKLGADVARDLWDLSLEAVTTVRQLIERFDIGCDLKHGICGGQAQRRRVVPGLADHMQQAYGLDCRFVEGEELRHLSAPMCSGAAWWNASAAPAP
jgi:gamma-glutamylputrescine oxidase